MSQEHIVDLLAGYALGCLDEEDLLKVARHLPHCQECRSELFAYWNVADQLALTAIPHTPPVDLKDKVLRRVSQAAASADERSRVGVPSGSVTKRSEGGFFHTLRMFFLRPGGALLGAIALLLIVFLALSNLLLSQQVRGLQARVPANDTRVVLLEGTENTPETHGYLMLFPDENYGTLVVEHAPALPEDRQYQLWLIHDGKRTSGGVFSVDRDGYGTLQISADRPLDMFSSCGVTVEPKGGSPGPTGEKVLGGDL